MERANKIHALEVSNDLIRLLAGTVESLEMNLSQLRDEKEGLELTIAALQEENDGLTENVFRLEAQAAEAGESALDGEDARETLQSVEEKLSFYAKEIKELNPKKLTAEDGETLYNILTYTYKTLRKAGVKV